MTRRIFHTAASVSSVLATAQTDSSTAVTSETDTVEVAGNRIFFRRYGRGPAILMVHGFPRTSLMWRRLAPKLAQNHTVILRRPARLQPKRDTRFYGRPLSLCHGAQWRTSWLT